MTKQVRRMTRLRGQRNRCHCQGVKRPRQSSLIMNYDALFVDCFTSFAMTMGDCLVGDNNLSRVLRTI